MIGGANIARISRLRTLRALAHGTVALAVSVWGVVYCAAGERPNILVVLADDLGYSDTSPFGGEMSTPNLESIAQNGVRLSNFYVCPRCSNTRASLLSGLQSHTVGLPNLAGDGTLLPKNHVFIPEVLQASGYHTYMSGKWHLGSTTNFGSIPGSSGVARDPRVRGFDSYWGFTESHSQDTFQGTYHLLSSDVPQRSYTTSSGNGQPGTFYQTDAVADYALDFLNNNRQRNAAAGTNSPFFTYVAFGAPHFPLQARDEWVDPLVSQYQVGWDQIRSDRLARMKALGLIDPSVQLPPRSDVANTNHGEALHQIRAWDSLSADRQGDLARRMAIYAAMVERVDYNVGRMLDDLQSHGELDNTIVVFLSDNGANVEWHEYGFNASETPRTGAALDSMGTTTNAEDDRIFYGSGWANVGNTPYRNYKHYVHEGGIKSAAMVQWPAGLDPSLVGEIGTQVGDVRDLMPTLLDLAGAEYPAEWTDLSGTTYQTRPLLSSSLAHYLTTGEPLGDREMGWQHEGNRAYRIGDWKIVSSNFAGTDGKPANKWELYNLASDPTESNDLSGTPQEAARLSLMISAYDRWAWWTNVSPTMPWSAADFDGDGNLDSADIQAFVSGWLQTETFGSFETFARGDVNLDGTTDLTDFGFVRKAFALAGQSSLLAGVGATLHVPEPSTVAQAALLVVLFKFGWFLRERQK
jgi:arylsulfatase